LSEQQIQDQARGLLEEGQVDCVIGYEMGSRGQVRPAFIYTPQDVERLVWNDGCTHNLTVYLHDKKKPPKRGADPPTVSIVVKPCDSRALNVLLAEGQIARERLHIIGLACEGVVEGAGFGGSAQNGKLQDRCQRCSERTPIIYDVLIGEPPVVEITDDFGDVAALQAMTPGERMAFWLKHFDRCIRCYACRQACPGCYCKTCMFERDDSMWIGMANEVEEKQFFHLGRAYHLASRCIECNECERVCPMDIPISLLNRKLVQDVQELFGYRAGLDDQLGPLLTMFDEGEESLI